MNYFNFFIHKGIDYEPLVRLGIYSMNDVHNMKRDAAKNNERIKTWAKGSITSHIKRGFILTFRLEDLITLALNNPHCYWCKCVVTTEYGTRYSETSRTIDNLDNKTQIDIQDIVICCKRCNRAKGGLSRSDFIEYCKMISKHFSRE